MEHHPHPVGDGSGLDDLAIDECLEHLGAATLGRLALIVRAAIVIVPVNHRLIPVDGKQWIVFRTQHGGILDQTDVHVAFEIDDCDGSTKTGWSVLVQGTLHHIDPDAADVRVRFDPEPWPRAERERWMVIEPYAVSGRRIVVD